MDKRLILVTVPNRDVAERITSALLSERLVACVSIVPGIESHYIWEGRTETSTELLLMMRPASTCSTLSATGSFPCTPTRCPRSSPFRSTAARSRISSGSTTSSVRRGAIADLNSEKAG